MTRNPDRVSHERVTNPPPLRSNPFRCKKRVNFCVLTLFVLVYLAEREGFEPPEPRSSTVFKTAAIDHSATSPNADAKIEEILNLQKE